YESSFMDPSRIAEPTPPKPAPNQPNAAPVQPPVASALHAPLEGGLPGSDSSSSSHFAQPVHKKSHLPMWLVMTLMWVATVAAGAGLFAGSVTALKSRRRRRRRHAAAPAAQVAGAWSELVDLCRDLGLSVPGRITRREQAAAVALADLAPLARRGDASIFGPGEPTDADVAEYWSSVDAARHQMRSGVSRVRRIRARLSLRSLMPQGAMA
ncbi:MAG TPA: hypothetical protein VKI19_01260, partial [Acidimicrobiales bacterium]|nr:hypothetical protein [Acidimicrobiales bacterium]